MEDDLKPLRDAIKELERKIAEDTNSEQLNRTAESIGEIYEMLLRDQPSLEDARLGMLVEVYSQALTQMRSSYRLSQTFASIGASLLFAGAAIALFMRGGHQIIGILTTVSGLAINLSSGVFLAQTSKAREHLERQADHLRDEVRMKEMLEHSEEVISKVADESRRDDLRTQIVLRILGGEQAIDAKGLSLNGSEQDKTVAQTENGPLSRLARALTAKSWPSPGARP
jgi:hypothetical protein